MLLTSFEVHDCLLLPPDHANRLFPAAIGDSAPVSPRPKLSLLYHKLYGTEPADGASLKRVGTATAYLFKTILQGSARQRLYVIARSPRSKRESLLEIEFAVPETDVESACTLYASFLSYVFEHDVRIDISPSEFSWAAPAYRFVNPEKPEMRYGAFGFVKKELLEALWPQDGPPPPTNICITGVSVETLVRQT